VPCQEYIPLNAVEIVIVLLLKLKALAKLQLRWIQCSKKILAILVASILTSEVTKGVLLFDKHFNI
jgi:hypothetical protein